MALLLDTCALIWIAEGVELSAPALQAIDRTAEAGDPVYVSPITAWELGLLVSRGRLALALDANAWFARVMEAPNVRLADMPPSVLIASSFLPGGPPRDPADRIVAATARAFDFVLMTRDRPLLDYGAQGHMKTLAC